MIVNVDSNILKAAYSTIVKQQLKLIRMGQNDQDSVATLMLLEQMLQQAGEYNFLQEMKQKMQDPWSNY